VLLDRKLMRQAHTTTTTQRSPSTSQISSVGGSASYTASATLAGAFVARWYVGSKVETTGSVFQVREDEPAPRIGAGLHRTP
jgi:hypothetical protein